MTNRITQKDLEYVVSQLNRKKGTPETSHTQNADGSFTTNIGNYRIDYAYGGCKLVQIVNESGGIRTVTSSGYTTKKNLYYEIYAILNS